MNNRTSDGTIYGIFGAFITSIVLINIVLYDKPIAGTAFTLLWVICFVVWLSND